MGQKRPKEASSKEAAEIATYDELRARMLGTRPLLRRAWEASLAKRKMALALVHVRKAAGLTQAELAVKAGWDKGFVSRLESASGGMPETATIMRYAEVCGALAGVVFGIAGAGELRIVDAVALSGDDRLAAALDPLREVEIAPAKVRGRIVGKARAV